MRIFEPLLKGVIYHVLTQVDVWETVDEDLNLAALEGILIYEIESWSEVQAGAAGHTYGGIALSKNPDVTVPNAIPGYYALVQDDDTLYLHTIEEGATTTIVDRGRPPDKHVRFVDPLLVVNNLRALMFHHTLTLHQCLTYWYKRVQLTEAEILPIIARRG